MHLLIPLVCRLAFQARAEPAGSSQQRDSAPARPMSAAPSAGAAVAAGVPRRPVASSSTSAGGAAGGGGGMKLVAKPKLGAQKLKPGDIDLESLLAD